MYQLTKELLQQAGYQRYEISNYALDGFVCRHNAGYWRRNNYLGMGLGAASMVNNFRFSNTSDFGNYLNTDFANEVYAYTDRYELQIYEQMEEFMFLGLRMTQGVSAKDFQNQFHKELEEVYGTVLDKQLKQGFINKTKNGYCLTDFGIDISNYVMAEYLLDP